MLQDWRKATGTFHILDQAQPHFETFKVRLLVKWDLAYLCDCSTLHSPACG